MNEKEKGFFEVVSGVCLLLFFFAVLVGAVCSLFTGCTTLKRFSDYSVERSSRAVGQLEATVQGLDRTTASSRERISNVIATSRGIEDGIARLEYLFTEYERETQRILQEVDRIRTEAQVSCEGYNDSGDTNSSEYLR